MIGKKEAQVCLDMLNESMKSCAMENAPEWTLIELNETTGQALVIAKDCIAQMPYDFPGGCSITWDKCTIRTWLNGEFYNRLPEAVRERIILAELETKDNCSIPGGENTKDHVFLLSIEELEKVPCELRPANYKSAPCWWWLRSPGYAATDVANVMPNGVLDGGLRGHGFYSHCDCGGIRPAIYLKLG